MLAGGGRGGAREIVMGVGTKGEGHYMWISGTTGVMGQVKNMIYGLHMRVGGKPSYGSVFCFRNLARDQPPMARERVTTITTVTAM